MLYVPPYINSNKCNIFLNVLHGKNLIKSHKCGLNIKPSKNTNFMIFGFSLWPKRQLYLQKDTQCTYNVTFRRVPETIFLKEKTISVTYSECVSIALVIQYAKRVRHVVIICGFCLVPPHFFHIISWTSRFVENLFYIKCVLILSKYFIRKVSHVNKFSASYCYKCTYVFM